MKSGSPPPNDDLRLIIEAKRSSSPTAVDVVSEYTAWLKAALTGAGIAYSYAACEQAEHYAFAAFTVLRNYRGEPVFLDIKVAEINASPYVFVEVKTTGKASGSLFPYFGNLQSDEDRNLLLHYVADFILSSDV
ncbi:hypothetical protein [Mucisphaera sp.]|uniref:hypothetical protein n=1 Tax=Mucisphaera sp. TaxID=2913024 RepID=UPI003D0982BF